MGLVGWKYGSRGVNKSTKSLINKAEAMVAAATIMHTDAWKAVDILLVYRVEKQVDVLNNNYQGKRHHDFRA